MSSPTVHVRGDTTASHRAPDGKAGGKHSGTDSAADQHPPGRWGALAVIGLAQLMVVLDATVVNIALPTAQHDLGFDNNGRQWIVTAYSLAFGSLLLLGGRLADLIGRRRTFLIGLLGFAAASAVGGAAQSFTMLVIARAAQGVFGSILAPSALSLLTTTFTDPKERAKAFGVFGAIGGSGGALGLLLGGLLTEHLSWRWTLYVNDIIAVFGLIGAFVFIRQALPAQRPKLDLLGVVLGATGLFSLVFGFSNADTHGWRDWMCWGYLTAGGVLLILFVVWQARTRNPLLPLRVLGDRNRAASYLSVFIAGTGMFGVFLFLTYYLQTTLHYSPVKTGISFLPMIGILMVTAQLMLNLVVPRIGAKVVVPIGMAASSAALVLFTRLDQSSSYPSEVLPPLLIMGVGLGMVMPTAMSLATLGVARQDQGVASAMVNTMQQVGGSIGTALFNTLAASAATDYAKNHIGMPDLPLHAALHSYSTAYWWSAGFFAAGVLISVIIYRAGRPAAQHPAPGAQAPAEKAAEPLPTRVPAHEIEGATAALRARAATPEPARLNGNGSTPVPAASATPTPAGHLTGQVRTTAGRLVPGAAVTLIDTLGRQIARGLAEENGAYGLPDPGPGSYVLVASAPGHQPRVATVQVGPAPSTFDLVLPAAGGMTGTVHSGWAPIAGALVVATDGRGDVAGTARCDDGGTYRMPDLTPGLYTLAVSAEGYQPSALTVDLQSADLAKQDIELRPAALISGTVRNPQGAPLQDIRVTLLDPAGNVLYHRNTGEDGAYAFTDLADGHYTVVASGYPPRATPITVTHPGGNSFDIDLRHEDEAADATAAARSAVPAEAAVPAEDSVG